MRRARHTTCTLTSGREPAARVLSLAVSPVFLLSGAFALAALAGCGGGGGGTDCISHGVPFMGGARCCPVLWTRDVPAGGSVLLTDQAQSSCNLTVETACAAGNCSGVRVRIGIGDVAVPSLSQFENVSVPEVRVQNDGPSASTVTVAISGWCEVGCST